MPRQNSLQATTQMGSCATSAWLNILKGERITSITGHTIKQEHAQSETECYDLAQQIMLQAIHTILYICIEKELPKSSIKHT